MSVIEGGTSEVALGLLRFLHSFGISFCQRGEKLRHKIIHIEEIHGHHEETYFDQMFIT